MTAPPSEPFDRAARRLRFRRAAAIGESFLLERMADEAIERLETVVRPLNRLLVVGPERRGWRDRLAALARAIDWIDPAVQDEDRTVFVTASYDAALALGSLDSVNHLPLALRGIAISLRPQAPLVGAMLGGNSLPLLRRALIETDRAAGPVHARSHPRIDPPTLAALLATAGYADTVVDIDRLTLRYASLDRLVADLRAAAATNALAERDRRWPGRDWCRRLAAAFAASAGPDGRVAETVEILHFHGWARAAGRA